MCFAEIEIIDLEFFPDQRGNIINLSEYHPLGNRYNLEKIVIEPKLVLRGFHGDAFNDKLISCLSGRICLVVVDYRKESSTFLKTQEIYLNGRKPKAVFVPQGFLNAHLSLTKTTFFYKWTHRYIKPEEQITVKYNSPSLNINWDKISNKKPWQAYNVSERDKNGLSI